MFGNQNNYPIKNLRQLLLLLLFSGTLAAQDAPTGAPEFSFPFDLSGEWFFTGRPLEKLPKMFGKGYIKLVQHGTQLSGTMSMFQSPNQGTPTPEGDSRRTDVSTLTGHITLSSEGRAPMVTINRLADENKFSAIFTGMLSEDGRIIDGWFVNSIPGRGVMRISRGSWMDIPVQGYIDNLSQSLRYQDNPDQQRIFAMADQFEQGLTERDADKVLALFVNDEVPFVGPGNTSDQLNAKPIGVFIRDAVQRDKKVEEKLRNRVITIQGKTAILVADYDYIVGGQKKGSGVETWTLILTDGGWKILSASFGNR